LKSGGGGFTHLSIGDRPKQPQRQNSSFSGTQLASVRGLRGGVLNVLGAASPSNGDLHLAAADYDALLGHFFDRVAEPELRTLAHRVLNVLVAEVEC
jgi:hypothetical protein